LPEHRLRRKALIVGISGQDGAYLARLLLQLGYEVHGTSRDCSAHSFGSLRRLDLLDRIPLHSVTLTDFRSVLQALSRVRPDEIYNLAGQTSVGLSFELPVETLESIAGGTLHLLEAIRFLAMPIRIYNACSTECFGDTGDTAADEQSRFSPRSPYAVAKAAAFWEVANYREAYNLYACSGILSNHESPLRPERFVTQKVVAGACRIAAGQASQLELGDVSIARDWGWAEEYVVAMHRMLQQPAPSDFVVATGETNTLQDFVAAAFEAVGLDWTQHVRLQPQLRRPTDISVSRLNPAKAARELGWVAGKKMRDVVRAMIEAYQDSTDR
jgi:GDPmannose 4,6-dehydratase